MQEGGGGSCAVRVQEGSRKGSRKGVSCAGRGGVHVQEGGGVPMQEGGSWGVPRMVPVQERGGGSFARRGFLGGSWDGSCAGKAGGFLSGMHMP